MDYKKYIKRITWISALIFICLIVPSVVLGALTDGVSAHWSFNNNTYDYYGKHNASAVSNIYYDIGVIGTSAFFNTGGTASYITIADHPDFQNNNGNFTINLWLWNNGTTWNYPGLIGSVTGWSVRSWGFRHSNGLSQRLSFHWNPVGDPTLFSNQADSLTLASNRNWYMATLVRRGSVFEIYLNGTLMSLQTNITSANGLNLSYGGIRFGYNSWDGSSGKWFGRIDEPTIWNRSLNQSEIMAIYLNESAGNPYPYLINISPTPSYHIDAVQYPEDLNSSVVGNIEFNISISNITGNITINENSSAIMYYNVTSMSDSGCVMYEQDICTIDGSMRNLSMTKHNDTYFYTSISEKNIFPTYYPFNENYIETAPIKYSYSLYNNNFIKFNVFNMSNNSFAFLSFEYEAYNNSMLSLMGTYYCNSSYISGNPSDNTNCEFIRSIPVEEYASESAHCHGASCHHVFNVQIRNVTRTKNSSFIIISSANQAIGGYNFTYVLNSSYNNRSFLIGNYNSWTATPNIFNIHLHQYLANDSLKYYFVFNDGAGITNISSMYSDYFNVVNQAPSSVGILHPNSTERPTISSVNTNVFVQWLQSYDNENNSFTYNVSFVNLAGIHYYLLPIISNMSMTSYNFTLNNTFIPAGNYSTYIIICDNNSACSISEGRNRFILCKNDYQRTTQPCNNNVRLVSFYDANYCDTLVDAIPLTNNTYENCTSVSYIQKTYAEDMLILLVLGFFIIVSIICGIWLHEAFFGATALFFGLMTYVFITYAYPTILIYGCIFMILLFSVMWIIINRARR